MDNFLEDNYLLGNKSSIMIYEAIKDLPFTIFIITLILISYLKTKILKISGN